MLILPFALWASIERLDTEVAITEQTRNLKSLRLAHKPIPLGKAMEPAKATRIRCQAKGAQLRLKGASRMTLSTRINYKISLRFGVLALCIFLLGAGRLFSQADTGSITGTVTDASGAVVPGVKVTIVAVATGQRQEVTTDGGGRYSSGPLRPGEYRVEAERAGFKHLVSKNVVLEVQEAAVMNLAMEVGGVQEVVTVTTAPPMVDTSDASQGSVIEEKSVANLPLNGRDYLQLALLSEGALPPPAAHTADGSGSNRAGGFSAGGVRTTDNDYLLDGFDNNIDDTSFDVDQAEVVKPSVDAIQEFKVQTNSYPAQFGRAAGGVVNLTMKSGTNGFHGTAYDFVRNQFFDARNDFNSGKQPEYNRNDYGLSVGGPVLKNKAFFFFAWEDLKLKESNIDNNTIPTAAMRQGNFSALSVPIYDPLTYNSTTNTRQPFPGNIIPSNRFDPVAQQLLSYFPTPQNSNLSQNYIYISPNDESLNRINTREDYRLSQKDQFSVIFNSQTIFIPTQPVLPPPAFGGDSRQQNVWGYGSGITWTHVVSPTLVTSTKAGWFGDRFQITYPPVALALGNVAAKIGLQVPTSTLPIMYPNFPMTGYATLGPGNFLPVWSEGQDRQVLNDTSWVKGGHTIQFGAGIEWIQTNNNNARNEDGTITFTGRYTRNSSTLTGGNAVADFLLGDVDNILFSTTTRIEARATMFDAYFQDEWKVAKQFTLNWGLRYQYLTPFHDIYDRLANVDLDTNPLQPQILLEAQTKPTVWVHNSPLDFEPRVGLVYSLFGDKVVWRAGYGVYSPFQRFSPFGDSDSMVVNPPYDVSITTSSNGITPYSQLMNGTPADFVSLQNATSVSLASMQRVPPHAYNQQWNLSAQYQFAENWMVQVGYIGSKGTHIVNLFDTNYVNSLGPGSVNPRRRFTNIFVPTSAPSIAGPVQGVTISPLSSILRQEYSGNTNFNGMQTTLRHQLSQGFTILGTWVWSKALGDTFDASPEGSSAGYTFQNPANIRGEYGLLDTHLAQSLAVSGIWDVPYGHGRRFGSDLAPWADAVLGGWSLDGILSATSGGPFSVTVNGNPSNSGQTDRPNIVGNPYSVSGGRTKAEFINTAAFAANAKYTYGDEQRNSIIGPRYTDIDSSLTKEATIFKVKDQPVNLQFRWDVFNIFNHPNYSTPGNVLGTPTFGQITSALSPRQMQFALKLIF